MGFIVAFSNVYNVFDHIHCPLLTPLTSPSSQLGSLCFPVFDVVVIVAPQRTQFDLLMAAWARGY